MAFSCSTVPFANEEFAGVTAIDTRVGAPTVRLVDPEIAPEVAVMDVLPVATPVASPALLIVPIAGSDDVHIAEEVRSWVLPSE